MSFGRRSAPPTPEKSACRDWGTPWDAHLDPSTGELWQPVPESDSEISQLLQDKRGRVDLAFSRFAIGGLEHRLALQRLRSGRDEREVVGLRFGEQARVLGRPVREGRGFSPPKGRPQFYESDDSRSRSRRRSPASWLDHGLGMAPICQAGRSGPLRRSRASLVAVGEDPLSGVADDLGLVAGELGDRVIRHRVDPLKRSQDPWFGDFDELEAAESTVRRHAISVPGVAALLDRSATRPQQLFAFADLSSRPAFAVPRGAIACAHCSRAVVRMVWEPTMSMTP